MWINYKGDIKNVEDFYAQQLVDKGKAKKVEPPIVNAQIKPQKAKPSKIK